MMKTINKIREITGQVSQKHVGAYAAQSAYFFVLSMIPIILLLLAIIQYTPVTKADVMTGKFVSGDKYAGFYGWHCK